MPANIPNLLSLSRIPLAILLCLGIAQQWWLLAFITFALAAITDWLDGWWARRFKQFSPIGRSLDPLTDKVLIGSAFIFLQSAGVGVEPWMVAVIISRELLVTGLRGMVEASGAKFGADWFGKLKTILQSLTLFAIFAQRAFQLEKLSPATLTLLYAALIATLGSGVQYCLKAVPLLKDPSHGSVP